MYDDILAVSIDDNEQNLMVLEAYADQMLDLRVVNFSDPQKALEFITTNNCDIIYVDYRMPKLNGKELIKEFRKTNTTTPIIMITAEGDTEGLMTEALEAGATDFLNKPIEPVEFSLRSKNLLELRKAQVYLQKEVDKATQELQDREHESLIILGTTAEWKDPETGSHIARVARYSQLLAQECGLSDDEQEVIYFASPFHDMGKVGIKDDILLKQGKLDDDQFEEMKKHSQIGYEILKDSNSKYLKMGATIALTHHEKYDGTGYPNKITGEDIPIYGRIVAIADVFDALTSIRPYKRAWGFDEAMAFLKEQSGRHFDPKLIDIFVANEAKVKEIYTTKPDDAKKFKDIFIKNQEQ
jgi:putative two-component system response regulator